MHCTENKRKAVDTNRIVMNALIAGKIISAAEGVKDHHGAFSRLHYSDRPTRRDKAILARYLADRVIKEKNRRISILDASELILYYSKQLKHMPETRYPETWVFLDQIIGRIENKVLRRVGLCVKELDTHE